MPPKTPFGGGLRVPSERPPRSAAERLFDIARQLSYGYRLTNESRRTPTRHTSVVARRVMVYAVRHRIAGNLELVARRIEAQLGAVQVHSNNKRVSAPALGSCSNACDLHELW